MRSVSIDKIVKKTSKHDLLVRWGQSVLTKIVKKTSKHYLLVRWGQSVLTKIVKKTSKHDLLVRWGQSVHVLTPFVLLCLLYTHSYIIIPLCYNEV